MPESEPFQPVPAPNWPMFAPDGRWLQVDIRHQRVYLMRNAEPEICFPISTALNGVGQEEGSGCTPLGWHKIRAKIGAGNPVNAVYRGRRWTGECYTDDLRAAYPDRDWILGRILWLSGLESGFNRGGNRDTMRRYIYFHGTPDTEPMGQPLSHGCIRMQMQDVVLLFDRVAPYTAVFIG